MAFHSAAMEQDLRTQATQLVAAYLNHVGTAETRPLAVETAMEAPLVDPRTGKDLGLPLVGIIDLVLKSPAGPQVVDFKTVGRSSQPLEITHEIQLSAYSYLFRTCVAIPEAGLEIRNLIKTKTPKVQFHTYPARTERHFQRLFAVIRAYLDALDAGRFVYRPGRDCSMCDYRDRECREWCG